MSDPTNHTAEPDDVLAELEEVRAEIAGIQDSWHREVVHVVPGWGLTV